jgi:ankyrin repeat protein
MLLRTDNDGRTAWHLAAYRGQQDIIQVILELAKEKLTTEEIRNEMLLRTDNEGRTAWHLAAYWGEEDTMQKIWD